MRYLANIVATIAFFFGGSVTAAETAPRQVVFVCEHGKVKSVMATSYFNQLAEQRGLPFRAISRGSATVAATDVADAVRVVTIGTKLPAAVRTDEQRIERWDDVPAASTDHAAASASLKAHVEDMIERLSAASEASPSAPAADSPSR